MPGGLREFQEQTNRQGPGQSKSEKGGLIGLSSRRRSLRVIFKDAEDICGIKFPRPPGGCRGFGWLRQIHPDLSAEALAGVAEPEGLFQRMEFLRTGQSRH